MSFQLLTAISTTSEGLYSKFHLVPLLRDTFEFGRFGATSNRFKAVPLLHKKGFWFTSFRFVCFFSFRETSFRNSFQSQSVTHSIQSLEKTHLNVTIQTCFEWVRNCRELNKSFKKGGGAAASDVNVLKIITELWNIKAFLITVLPSKLVSEVWPLIFD